jgi:hypothetical protein
MEDEQDFVASILRSTPPADVRGDFVARVNARIDRTAGWLDLADFRVWTLRLAPVAAALTLVAALWSSASSPNGSNAAGTASSQSFSPASSSDWQRDVSGDSLLEAALAPRGGADAR